MAFKCLFAINGLGLGNSTRCFAVMEELFAKGVDIHVITSGNGLKFFENRPEISSLTAMESFYYSQSRGRLSAFRTFLSLLDLLRLARRKSRQMGELLDRLGPDVLITDSEYTLRPARRRGVPVIALNNSDVVVSEYLALKSPPRSIKGQFWLVEFFDYLFHRFFVDLVVSPSLKPLPPRHERIRRVGLILRRRVFQAAQSLNPAEFPSPRSVKRAVFMISGSVLGSRMRLAFQDLPFEVQVIGREGESRGRVTFLGRQMDNVDYLAAADVLVVNGGFSAVCEAVALKKPVLVVPVPNHAEQYVNAAVVAEIGRGYLVDETTVMDRLKEAYARDEWEGGIRPDHPVDLDGAAQAAGIVLSFLEARRGVTPE